MHRDIHSETRITADGAPDANEKRFTAESLFGGMFHLLDELEATRARLKDELSKPAPPNPLLNPDDERLLSRTFRRVEALDAVHGQDCAEGQALLFKVCDQIERRAIRRSQAPNDKA
jgi:hypothetical protein